VVDAKSAQKKEEQEKETRKNNQKFL